MRILLPAVAASLLLASAAHAAPAVNVTFDEKVEKKFVEKYGVREKDYLAKDITRRVTQALPTFDGVVNVTVVDAVPNRPTFEQLGNTPGLSLQSFGIGGAELKATVTDASGKVVAETDYRWFEDDIRWAWAQSTWGDANTAIDRFGRRLGKAVASAS